MVVDIVQDLLYDAVAECFALNRICPAHDLADYVQKVHHQGVIAITFKGIVLSGAAVSDTMNTGYEDLRVIIAELICAHISGRVLAEEVFRVDLAAAQYPQHLRREIQVSPFVIPHFPGAG